MSFPFERSAHPCFDNLFCQVLPDNSATKDEDVCIVVEPAHFCCEELVAQGGPDPGELICYNRHPYTRPADKYPFLYLPRRNGFGDLRAKIRIIHCLCTVRTII